MSIRRAVCYLLSLSLAAPAMQDESALQLRADTRIVEIDVSVRDSKGKPVEDLKKPDFTVTDNGKPRAFTIFSVNRDTASPAAPPVRPALPPNVFTNIGASMRPPEGHSTIILLDAMNGWFVNFVWARAGVIGLMAKVPADEKIAIYVLQNGDGLGLLQDYTVDRSQIKDALTRYIPRGMAIGPLGIGDDGERMGPLGARPSATPSGPGGPPPPDASKATPREGSAKVREASEAVRLSLQGLAEKLRTVPGRKSVFWVTQGFPPTELRGMNQFGWDKTISALNDANIAVNTIDDNGWGGPKREKGPGAIFAMQQIAEATGCVAYFHRNELDDEMASGIADSRRGYTLGFYLTEIDGKYHKLNVHVDRPGLELNYRQGYDAQSEAVHDLSARKSDLEAALFNPSGSAGVGITAKLDVVPGKPRATLTAHLKLDSETLSLKEVAGGWNGKIDELFLEQNAAGREVGRVSVTKVFEVGAKEKLSYDSQGAMLSQPIPIAPGAVRLSIVVRDTASGRTGSLTIPLENVVPQAAGK